MTRQRPVLATVTLTCAACLIVTLLLGAAAPTAQRAAMQLDPTQLQMTIDAAVQQALESTSAAEQVQITPNMTATIEAALWQAVTATAQAAAGNAAPAINSGAPAASSFSVSDPVATALPQGGAPAQGSVSMVEGYATRGPADAPIEIVEFGDFFCQYCARFAAETLEPLLAQYEGRVRFIFRHFPVVDALSSQAAEAAVCAQEQQAFWPYHDQLFANQDRLSMEVFISLAGSLGLDTPTFTTCLTSGRYRATVEADRQAAVTLGASGTPAFFINGQLITGAQPLAAFQNTIDALLGVRPEIGAIVNGDPRIELPDVTLQPITAGNIQGLTKVAEVGTGEIREIAAAPDGHTVAVATMSGVWFFSDLTTPGEWILSGHIATRLGTNNVAYSSRGDQLAVGDDAGDIYIYAAGEQEPSQVFSEHTEALSHLAWSPDGRWLASSGGGDRTVRLWDVANGLMRLLESHDNDENYMNYVSWSPTGDRLATAGWDGIVRIYNPLDGALVGSFDNGIWANSVDWSPDGTRIATAGDDNRINLWDGQTYDWLSALTGPDHPTANNASPAMWRAVWSPDGREIASLTWFMGSGEPPYSAASLWNAETGERVNDLTSESRLRTLSWMEGQGVLVAHKLEATLLNNAHMPVVLFSRPPGGLQIAWSPDSTRLAYGRGTSVSIVFGTNGQSAQSALRGAGNQDFVVVAWSPDGSRIAAGGTAGQVEVWNVGGPLISQVSWAANTEGLYLENLTWSPDGETLITLDGEDRYMLWNARTGGLIASMEGFTFAAPAWSPDGSRIAVGGNQQVFIRDGYSGDAIDAWALPNTSAIYDVTFSPDGTTLALNCSDATLRLMDAYTGEILSEQHLSEQYYGIPAWSPDQRMLTLLGNYQIAVWGVVEGPWGLAVDREIFHETVPGLWVYDPVWSPDGMQLAWLTWDGTIQIWGVPG